MRTRSSTSSSPLQSLNNIPRRRNRRRARPIVEPEIRTIPPIMAAEPTMNELLQAPIEGYGDAIVVPAIVADNFELKTGLINLVTSRQFYGFERDDPQDHIRWFNKITSTIKCKNVPEEAIKLLLFPFSLDGTAKNWLDKQPPRSIETWEDLVKKFVNEFFPPSKTTALKNEIMKFTQKFDESFNEAWDRFKDMLRKCPHHGFSELMQLDTFYNGVSQIDQDSLNASAGGNFLNRTTRDALAIIENKSKVRIPRSKPIVSHANASPSTSLPVAQSSTDARLDKLTEAIHALVLTQNKKVSPQASQPAEVKKIEVCVTCGGPHAYYNCTATEGNPFEVNAIAGSSNQGGNQYRPQMEQNYRASNQSGPPGFPQNFNQNRNQNQNRMNQGFQNQGNFNQGFQNQGNLNRNQGYGNQGNNFHGNGNHNQGNFQHQAFNQNNRAQNSPNQNQAIVQTQSSTDELLKQFMKAQEETNRLLVSQISELKKSLNDRPSRSGTLPSNTIANPKGDVKAITTRSGVSYDGPSTSTTPPKEVEREPEVTKNKVQSPSPRSTAQVQPPEVQTSTDEFIFPKSIPKPSIPYPSRLNDQKLRDKTNLQMKKFLEIFQKLHFDISFADALLYMPKFASTFKSLLSNKEKMM